MIGSDADSIPAEPRVPLLLEHENVRDHAKGRSGARPMLPVRRERAKRAHSARCDAQVAPRHWSTLAATPRGKIEIYVQRRLWGESSSLYGAAERAAQSNHTVEHPWIRLEMQPARNCSGYR